MKFKRICAVEFDTEIKYMSLPKSLLITGITIQFVIYASKRQLLMWCDIEFMIPRHKEEISLDYLESWNEKCERALESGAELLAVINNTGFKLNSMVPSFMLKNDNNKELKLIHKLSKLIKKTEYPSHFDNITKYQSFNLTNLERFDDRLTGVNSLAETLSTQTPVSKYKELVRFFENAFKMPFEPSKMVRPLSNFLHEFNLGYSAKEVHEWSQLRGGVVHGDKKKGNFYFERDISIYLPRFFQAAIIVLENKKEWHSPSTDRRSMWKPDFRVMNIDSTSFQVVVNTPAYSDMGTYRDVFGSWKMRNNNNSVDLDLFRGWIALGLELKWSQKIEVVES